jgi:hypothetical protein
MLSVAILVYVLYSRFVNIQGFICDDYRRRVSVNFTEFRPRSRSRSSPRSGPRPRPRPKSVSLFGSSFTKISSAADDDGANIRRNAAKMLDSFFESETFAFNEFNPNTTKYTIISVNSPALKELLASLKAHNKNYVFVDTRHFTNVEFATLVTKVLPQHVLDEVVVPANQPTKFLGTPDIKNIHYMKSTVDFTAKMQVLRNSTFVFENEYDYVGGMFEMYERLHKDDEELAVNEKYIIKSDDKHGWNNGDK